MKPYLSEIEDSVALQNLGRASVQILHDLKNQLNGLKLYATFLQKRLVKAERPTDELETLEKVITGVDRIAGDMAVLVQLGRPLTIKKQAGVDIQTMMSGIVASLAQEKLFTGPLGLPPVIEQTPEPLAGEFDPVVMTEALKSVTIGAVKMRNTKTGEHPLRITLARDRAAATAVIEWHELKLDHDPFRSFVGGHEIRMSQAARIIEVHGGSAESLGNKLRVNLPLQ